MTFDVIERAVRVSMLEMHFQGDELEKTAEVSFALLDLVDACLEHGLITPDDPYLPAELNFYLRNVYDYLGDPLELHPV